MLASLALLASVLSLAAPPAAPPQTQPPAPDRVAVEPTTSDAAIAERLTDILTATGWFENVEVEARDGVVFLRAIADDEEHKRWAAELARSTQDVAAVVNQIDVADADPWDFDPAIEGLRSIGRAVVGALPLAAFSLLILAVACFLAWLAVRAARWWLRPRLSTPLLREVVARAVGFAVFLLGLYIVFRVAGLTRVALTVLGGTGLIGLVLGIAFRSITENFLSSIFLSIQQPFRTGDLVSIGDETGYVQRLTTRATLLMTLDGNHVQIPNSTVYSSAIRNYTSNRNRREDFIVGIGYDDNIADAQAVALKVLGEHPAVLKDPEPWVLVQDLGKATVNLRVYFWLDGHAHSWLKVRSSVIRLVKRAFQAEGISMPDEARELIFPDGVPVQVLHDGPLTAAGKQQRRPFATPQVADDSTISTAAEAGLSSEAGELKEQARLSRTPEEGQNLLD